MRSRRRGPRPVRRPEGFVASVDDGADFLVYRFAQVGGFDTTPASAGIYLGDHAHFAPTASAPIPDTLLGQSIAWYDEVEPGRHQRATLVPLARASLHIFFEAGDEATFETLFAAMRTLR